MFLYKNDLLYVLKSYNTKEDRFLSITDLNFSCTSCMDVLNESEYNDDTYTYKLKSICCTAGKNKEDRFLTFFVLPPIEMIEETEKGKIIRSFYV